MQHIPNLLTVKQFCEKHKAFSAGGLRYNIFHADKNGFSMCIRRIGRKVLIDETEFFRWVQRQNTHVEREIIIE